ncbi:YcaO-like family protein [Pseudoalteromonas aurantia]|uniref:YcaO domain-containing protein n=1 Tax=Pseudoalteromonas aurantia 208 TaxID=1314867 RepID=A0ABR9E7R7_9GAMM|nr:YcaO-like family protein [Pseudoalteromonas aurantia]MBE0366782.1 hypothetical protein [Pseudoalteromonas aurantia 208]
MNTNQLIWHPKFLPYRFERIGVLLIAEHEFFWLSERDYPAVTTINDTLAQPLQNASTIAHSTVHCATFLYRANQLVKHKILCNNSDPMTIKYRQPSPQLCSQLYVSDNFEIKSISSAASDFLKLWSMKLQTVLKSKEKNRADKLHILLVDDLLDKQLLPLTKKLDKYCVIKVTGNILQFTPIFSKKRNTSPQSLATKKASLRYLQDLLRQNRPVNHFIACQSEGRVAFAPYELRHEFLEPQWQDIQRLLKQQMESHHCELLQYDIANDQTSTHLIPEDRRVLTLQKTLFGQPILLQSSPITYNTDGGSRTLTPEQTILKIMPFVDPVTGFISHLKPLETKDEGPIKIYQTAFFKTPLGKHINRLDNSSFVQSCLGKGVSHAQSQASALCEAIERRNAQYQGNEPFHISTAHSLNERHMSFHQLAPFSEKQYAMFCDINNPESQRSQAVRRYHSDSIHWFASWSLSNNERVYLPLSICFANIPFTDDSFGRWHSNGAAAGNSLEEAILQGLFELIERDATAIWWYNQIHRPAFELSRIALDYFAPLNDTLKVSHNFWVLDLTHDFGIPVMAAVGEHLHNGGLIFGFGCHLEPEMAAQRALTELCQLIPVRDQKNAPFDFDAITKRPFLYPQNVPVESVKLVTDKDIKNNIQAVVAALEEQNIEVLVVDYTRDELPINTAKVIAPGLCHIWPQLANQRLYQVPVDLGWVKQAKNESTINQQGLYV